MPTRPDRVNEPNLYHLNVGDYREAIVAKKHVNVSEQLEVREILKQGEDAASDKDVFSEKQQKLYGIDKDGYVQDPDALRRATGNA